MEFKVLIKKRDDGDFQMARNGWIADYNDASTFLTLVQCDSDQNHHKNCNRKAEELITQGNQSTDPARISKKLFFDIAIFMVVLTLSLLESHSRLYPGPHPLPLLYSSSGIFAFLIAGGDVP